jgi:hypothetical protein
MVVLDRKQANGTPRFTRSHLVKPPEAQIPSQIFLLHYDMIFGGLPNAALGLPCCSLPPGPLPDPDSNQAAK